jgi:predicted branched-subunit amino acid permease
LAPAITPLGIALGVALGSMSTPTWVTWLSAPLMVAGASQLVLFSQIDDGSSLLLAALASIVLNARFIVYGAALSDRFTARQPRWFRLLGPHYIVDQTYAMTVSDISDDDDADDFRGYFVTAGTVLWVAWTCSVGVGLLVGPVVPSQIPLEFVLPASFLALVVPGLGNRSEVAAVLVGAACASNALDPAATVALSAVGGAMLGVSSTRRSA